MQIVSVKLLKTVCNANSLLPVDCCGCFIRTSGARNPGVPALCADWTLLKREVGYHQQKPPHLHRPNSRHGLTVLSSQSWCGNPVRETSL